MTWLVVLAAAVVSAVAAAGVLRPFGRSRAISLERLADPLDDERLGLLRALRDLDEERATGELDESSYRALRLETETRTVAVLRALEARDGAGTLSGGLRSLRGNPDGNGAGATAGRRSRVSLLATAVLGSVAVAVVAVLLSAAVGNRGPDQPITGGIPNGGATSALTFFQKRVADHPRDLAARLDLAEQYLESGNVQGAIAQYLVALQIDPTNAEAHAQLGFVIYRSGKAEDGLRTVQQALDVQPDYAEALYYKGVILLQGLNRPADAAEAFRRYLQTAPYGARRAQVESLLKQAASG